ncbi:MAG: CAP domain-containing protein, partial [Clostridia bacterium]|nr:CAP domain-containing protein [Clostridia bacterium]
QAVVKPAVTTTEATTETTTQAVVKPAVTTTEATTETTTQKVTVTETSTETTTSSENNSMARQLLTLVNQARAENGLSALTLNDSLSNVAQKKADDMKNNNYFSHTSPTYGSPFDMIKNAGISYKAAGENIAKGQKTAEAVFNAWMNSSGHRANILNSQFTQMGVGVTSGTTYWCQMFIG